jgi:hypothetical protein
MIGAVTKRLREEFGKLQVEINDQRSRAVDLERSESFGFLGFDFRYLRSLRQAMRPHYTPKLKKRTTLMREVKEAFRRHQVATDWKGDKPNQSNAAGVGELLRGRALRCVLRLQQRLGEGQAPFGGRLENNGASAGSDGIGRGCITH